MSYIEIIASKLYSQVNGETTKQPEKLISGLPNERYALVTIKQTKPNVVESDGAEFGWSSCGTVFGLVDVVEQKTYVTHTGEEQFGGAWDCGGTRYVFKQVEVRGESIVLVGDRIRFNEHYDERRAFTGGWVYTEAVTHLEVTFNLKKDAWAMSGDPGE